MESKRRVIYVPPSDEVLRDIARGVCKRMGHPEHTYDLANFLMIVAKSQASALNRAVEEAEEDGPGPKKPEVE